MKMKRRSFIIASLLSLAGISGLSLFWWNRKTDQTKILATPKLLSELCDEDTILTLGRAYLKIKPEESNEHTLVNDLLEGKFYKIISEKQKTSIIESEMEKKIVHDFDTNNIVMLQGWVLSVTEARQCALFSILNE